MGCCSPKECAGKWGIIFFATAFTIVVFASVSASDWVSASSGRVQQQLGPFYSQVRVCDYSDPPVCPDDWTLVELSMDDCYSISTETLTDTIKLCNNLYTWRLFTILCSIITFITACLVLVGFINCVTCGCCGGSFDQIAVLGYWIEVLVSIVTWSFAISVRYTLRELYGIDSDLLWGFWLFVASGK